MEQEKILGLILEKLESIDNRVGRLGSRAKVTRKPYGRH